MSKEEIKETLNNIIYGYTDECCIGTIKEMVGEKYIKECLESINKTFEDYELYKKAFEKAIEDTAYFRGLRTRPNKERVDIERNYYLDQARKELNNGNKL